MGLLLFIAILQLGGIGKTAHADTIKGRLITVHDRGQEVTFVTDKATLKAAFNDAGIKLDVHDAVEPGLDEQLVASDYQVNIYRARPVTIIDGALRQRVVTPYQSADKIIKDAGIRLHAEDLAVMSRSTDFTGDGAGLQLTIQRSTPLTLDLYGSLTTVRTQATTVGDLLEEKSIELGAAGRVLPSVDTPITKGMHLRVWREGRQTVTAKESVNFKVKQIQDADQPVGYKKVKTPGAKGKRTVTYEIEIKNGKEVARKEIASLVTKRPTTQIEVVGTKPQSLPYTGGGTKTEWLAASNIPEESWGYADFMVHKESSWNPNAYNTSSGACGLAQALPCSKIEGDWHDPVTSLNWMNNYVNGRYGGWKNAYTFWISKHWY